LKLAYVEEARYELRDAAVMYRRLSKPAAQRFRAEIKALLARIMAHPKQFPAIDDLHRRAMLSGFPYSLVFQNPEGVILIVATAHASRDPAYWHGRT
jgi:toxin ParE1/3/4